MRSVIISLLISAALIGGAIVLSSPRSGTELTPEREEGSNITVEDGTQIIEIDAKGGYSPRRTVAKAGLPTIIRVNTKATFDCSSALVIPELDYRKNLPPSGVTDIPLPPQETGASYQGLCSMGMYSFVVEFI